MSRHLHGLQVRPALTLSFLLIVGILSHPIAKGSPWLVIFVVGLFLLLAAANRRRAIGGVCLAGAVAGCGALSGAIYADYFGDRDIGQYLTDTQRLAQLELTIDQEPRLFAASGAVRPLPPKQIAQARVVRVRTWEGWVPCDGRVLLSVDQPHPRLGINQTVRVLGWVQRPWPAMNPGQFDWAAYYRSQRILASVRVPHVTNLTILTDPGPGLLDRLREKARTLLAAGFPATAALDHALLRAMLLGDDDPQLRDVQDAFQRTGASYHITVSGLHIMLLGGVVYFLARLANPRPRVSLAVAAVFVITYGFVALPGYSGLRSVTLFAAFALAAVVGRPTDRYQSIALAALAVLLWNPLDVYSAGFQMSYATVIGVALFVPPLLRWAESFRDEHAEAAAELSPAPIRRRFQSWVWKESVVALAVGVVAWAVTLPISQWHFGAVNPWSIAADALLVPFTVIALLGGLMKVVFTLLWPSGAGWWAWVARWPVVVERHVVGWLAKIPASEVPLPAPPWWAIVLFFALLLVPLLPALARWPRGRRFIAAASWMSACAMVVLLPRLAPASLLRPAAGAELRLTLLAIGAGQVAVLEPPGGEVALIDAGSSSVNDLVRKVIGPFLRYEQRPTVDAIFLSHGDYDHVSAAADVAQAYNVSAVYVSPHFRRHATDNLPDEELLDTLDRLDLGPKLLEVNDTVALDAQTSVSVLWPPKECDFNSNNCGLVLRVTYGGRSILFAADIQEPAMRELLKHPERLKSDVLIAPHHGSYESTTPAFVEAVSPSVTLSSNDRTLTNKQKQFDALMAGRAFYRTNACGALTLTISRDGTINVEPWLKKPSK